MCHFYLNSAAIVSEQIANCLVGTNKWDSEKQSDRHGAPWFETGVGQIHVVTRVFDGLYLTSRLVAGEQTPAPGSQVGQHDHWTMAKVIQQPARRWPSSSKHTHTRAKYHPHRHEEESRRNPAQQTEHTQPKMIWVLKFKRWSSYLCISLLPPASKLTAFQTSPHTGEILISSFYYR